jgi:hypothetical protein
MAALDNYKVVSESVNVARGTGDSTNIIPVRAYQFNRAIDQVSAIIDGGTSLAKVTSTGSVITNTVLVENRTLTAVATTAAATLTVVKAGLVAGGFSSTSAAAVAITLDSVANIISSFSTAGITLAAGSNIQFIVDNSAGANTITVAVDSGATIAVATPVITGGATLTISTANKIALFNLYLTSTTAGILSRII